MKCKIFSVPLDSEHALEQEQKLNEFLAAANVKRVFASLADQPEGPLWSVLFLYEGEASTTRRSPEGRPATASFDRRPTNGTSDTASTFSAEEARSIIALKKWRADAAAVEGVPLYMVANNKWLEEIVRIPVRSVDDLKKVGGFGEWRVQKYGPKIIEILKTVTSARRTWPAPSYPTGRA